MTAHLKRFRKADFILLVIVLFLCMGVLASYHFLGKKGNTVTVEVDGQVFGTYSLFIDATIPIGEHNTITIKDGKVKMDWADCPNQICVHHAAISKAGQSIVCLPNKIVVTINGTAETDAIAEAIPFA